MTKHNFYAGPAILPKEVLSMASKAVNELDGIGLSLVEISHRSKEFTEIMNNARKLVRDIYELEDDYEVLFLQGGASLQFCMAPYNLMPTSGKAAYLNTGNWSKKAIKEAKIFGEVDVVGTSEDDNFSYIPKDFTLTVDHAYFHITTNNTIYGTEIHDFDRVLGQAKALNIPVVADMSSDIFSRTFDMNQIDLAYAGAQKNLGPAGTTLIIVRKSILGKTDRTIPTLLDYNTHIGKESMFNTPSVFAVYTSMLTLEWLKANGGLKYIEKLNKEKSDKLYDEIDRNALFEGTAAKEDRSRMNLTFVSKGEDRQGSFLRAAADANILGIKGHRSVGGFRASLYNALPLESVNVLIELMKDFENGNA